MNNKAIGIFVAVLVAFVLAILLFDIFEAEQEDKFPSKKTQPTVHATDSVDYKEVKQIKIAKGEPKSLSYYNGKLYLLVDDELQVVDKNGSLLRSFILKEEALRVEVLRERIFVLYEDHFSELSQDNITKFTSAKENENAHFTSVALQDTLIYIADAGNRKVLKYNLKGKKIGEFEGISGAASLHGFIIPSPYFDIVTNSEGELWAVNPGMHSLQQYSADGNLQQSWRRSSMRTEGFSGCCNPAHIALLPNGNFVTSEKGLVRIKVYEPNGKFVSVVVLPNAFSEEGHAPDVATDEAGNIIALDFDKKRVRFFSLNQNDLIQEY